MHAPSRTMLSSLILLILMAASALLAPAASAAPGIHFDQPTFDFGTIFQEDRVDHEFVVRNIGDAPLKIDKVTSSCGCTAVLPPKKEIAPGATAPIRVTFRSGRMKGPISKSIYVESNDPAQPKVTLTITGVVKQEVEISPGSVLFGNVGLGRTVERTVTIRPVDVKSFRILEVRSDHKAVRVDTPEALKDKQGGYRLRVHFGPFSQPERVYSFIVVRTDLKHVSDLRITVYGKAGQPESKPAPPSR